MRHANSLRIIWILAIAFLTQVAPVYAAQDPNDFGAADTVVLALASYPDATTSQYQFRLDVYCRFDADTVGAMTAGFVWSNPGIRLDSVRAGSVASVAFDYAMYFYYKDSRDSSNAHRWFIFAGARIHSSGLIPSASRQLLAKYYFTATSWNTSDSVVFDSLTFTKSAKLKAVKTNLVSYKPIFSKRLVIYDVPPPTLVSPANGDSTELRNPTLDWNDVTGADKYRVQVDNDSTFGSPNRDVSNLTSTQWTVSPSLSIGTWYWRVNATDDGTGKTSGWSAKWKVKTGILVEKPLADELPTAFELHQNYPNPFNPSTAISFDLPVNSHVKLTIYNSLGQVVTTLVDEELEAGAHALIWDASGQSSGIYLYRLTTGDFVKAKKMLLLK